MAQAVAGVVVLTVAQTEVAVWVEVLAAGWAEVVAVALALANVDPGNPVVLGG